MKNGCNINKVDHLGQTALYLGVLSPSKATRNSEIIRKMLKAGRCQVSLIAFTNLRIKTYLI